MDNKVPQQVNDIVGDNVKKLAQLFPSAVKDGEVDFEALKEELGEFQEVGSEKYELTWAGKKNAKKIAQEDVVGRTLKFIPEDSKNADTTENLYIEGDNLEVLKLLRQNYYGAIKMIYIDPPYNTGNDFVYNDSFLVARDKSDMEEGYVGNDGEVYGVNKESSNRFHANWLSMIYPRLKIAKDLLKENGVIFISIDDGELDNIKKVCNEVFGERNFVECLIWKKRATPPNDRSIGRIHEFILCYAKNIDCVTLGLLPRDEKSIERYTNPDNDPRGAWVASDLSANGKGGRIVQSCIYPIHNPYNGKDYYPSEGRCWLFNKEKMDVWVKEGRVSFRENTGAPFLKRYFSEVRQGLTLPTIMTEFGFSMTSAAESDKLFEKKGIFEYAKPTTLINPLIRVGCPGDNEIVMDFFSGSATTAHALFQLNMEKKYHNKFILVQIPENTDEKSEAYKSGYKNICEIGKERISRAGNKIKSEYPDTDIDIGFKVFRTADTNIKWNSLIDIGQIDINQMEVSPDTIDFLPGAKDVDIVYELMLRQNDVPLSSKIEQIFGGGYERTYLYADSYLVCLETKITNELIDKLAEIDPLPIKFIFRDSAFQDDIALKDETFRRLKALIEKNHGMQKMAYTVEFL